MPFSRIAWIFAFALLLLASCTKPLNVELAKAPEAVDEEKKAAETAAAPGFVVCGHSSSDADCVAARGQGGSGDAGHRPISCVGWTDPRQAIGIALHYVNNKWMYEDLSGTLRECDDNTTLVALIGTAGSRVVSCPSSDPSDRSCDLAESNNGLGDGLARAINCLSSTSVVRGQSLRLNAGTWEYYSNATGWAACKAGSLVVGKINQVSASSTLLGTCSDDSLSSRCQTAMSGSGVGSARIRALNCSYMDFATVGSVLRYKAPGWVFVSGNGTELSCNEDSVLVATW